MHTFITVTALYASISTVAFAIVFVGYLEVYTWLTKGTLSNSDPLSWRTVIPKYSMWMTVFSGIIGAIATLANLAGL